MKIALFPLWMLPVIAAAIIVLAWLLSALIDQAHLRGAYQVWQENETFAAAALALLAAMYAARPVYMQVRAQSVQAALELLHRTEADTAACIDARNRLFELRRAALSLAAAIDGDGPGADAQDLKEAFDTFLTVSRRDVRALAERPTVSAGDQMKIVALGAVLAIAQKIAIEMLAQRNFAGGGGEFPLSEREFIRVKLAGLFNLSTEIAENLEPEERNMRERVVKLRQAADNLLV